MLHPPGQNQYTVHESCKLMQWVISEWSSDSALLHLDCWFFFLALARVLWPCSKPLRALLPRGTLVYDTFLHNVPSHCLSQFLVQVTARLHEWGFRLSPSLASVSHSELKCCPQHRIPLSLIFKASITHFPCLMLGHAPPKKPQSFTVLQLLP